MKRDIPFQPERCERGGALVRRHAHRDNRNARCVVQAKLCHGRNEPSM